MQNIVLIWSASAYLCLVLNVNFKVVVWGLLSNIWFAAAVILIAALFMGYTKQVHVRTYAAKHHVAGGHWSHAECRQI